MSRFKWLTAWVYCPVCQKEWVAVMPIDAVKEQIECPYCGACHARLYSECRK